jgi:hypothetical protein
VLTYCSWKRGGGTVWATNTFHFPDTRPFTFIVHRALLDHIPAAYRACAPFCSTLESAPETVQVPREVWGSLATGSTTSPVKHSYLGRDSTVRAADQRLGAPTFLYRRFRKRKRIKRKYNGAQSRDTDSGYRIGSERARSDCGRNGVRISSFLSYLEVLTSEKESGRWLSIR